MNMDKHRKPAILRSAKTGHLMEQRFTHEVHHFLHSWVMLNHRWRNHILWRCNQMSSTYFLGLTLLNPRCTWPTPICFPHVLLIFHPSSVFLGCKISFFFRFFGKFGCGEDMLQPTFCLLKTVDSSISSPGISAEPTKVAGGTAASGLHAPEERNCWVDFWWKNPPISPAKTCAFLLRSSFFNINLWFLWEKWGCDAVLGMT